MGNLVPPIRSERKGSMITVQVYNSKTKTQLIYHSECTAIEVYTMSVLVQPHRVF